MAYEIHIARRDPDSQILPIALSEWRAAAQQTPGVRMAKGDSEITNPKTGEIIRLRNAGGDAEVFFPVDAEWLRVFCWSPSGRVSFRHPVILICPLPSCGALLRSLLAPWEHHLLATRERSTTEQRVPGRRRRAFGCKIALRRVAS
jgi:hypothetical protein